MDTRNGVVVFSSKDVETVVSDGITRQWFNAKQFSFAIAICASGSGHFRHNHPEAEEFIYTVSGEAILRVFQDGKVKEYPSPPGTMAYIPEGVEHEAEVCSGEPWKVLCVYAPGGQDEGLREKSGVYILPPGTIPT